MSDEPANRPLIDPDVYAGLVRTASDEDLQAGLDQNGELILEQIFQAMPSRLKPNATAGISLVADWKIRDAGQAGELRWQVTIADQQCSVHRDGQQPADVTYTIRAIDFIKLITGNAHPPLQFLTGRLRIRGDLLKAARFQHYFHVPQPKPDSHTTPH